ncbi:hypothetical protein PMAYCL1PPCAC_25071, partial [Pristionchus mayeri]
QRSCLPLPFIDCKLHFIASELNGSAHQEAVPEDQMVKTRKQTRDEEVELGRRQVERTKKAGQRVKSSKDRRQPKGEDYLSNLPSDCLLDVLERLSYRDLDAMATVSRRLSSIAAASRQRAPRAVAERLTVVQYGDRSFDFRIFAQGSIYTGRFTNNNCRSALLSRVSVRKALPEPTSRRNHLIFKPQSISGAITTRAAQILQRFDFRRCALEYVSIDDNFLSFLEEVTASRSFITLELNACYFDTNLSEEGRERFLSIIRSAKPWKLRLDMPYDAPIVDENFLDEFANSGKDLHLHLFAEDDESTRRRPSTHFAEALPNFRNLVMLSLTLDTNWIMLPLFKRLRDKQEGYWKFRVTRQIQISDINAALDAIGLLWPQADYDHGRIMFPYGMTSPQGHYIRSTHDPTEFIVTFNTIPASFGQWTLVASFSN